jgi:hypothetical protein
LVAEAVQSLAEESDRVTAQAQALAAVIFDNFAAHGHRIDERLKS